MGGYLVARGATQVHRAQVIVLDDGVYYFGFAFRAHQPSFIRRMVEQGYDSVYNWMFHCVQSFSTGIPWALQNGKWTFGVESAADLSRAVNEYTLEGISQSNVTPCLIIEAENDHFLKGQPELFRKNLCCEKAFLFGRESRRIIEMTKSNIPSALLPGILGVFLTSGFRLVRFSGLISAAL